MLPALALAKPVVMVDGAAVSATVSNNWLSLQNIGSGQHSIVVNQIER